MKIRTKYRVFIDESQPELGHIDKGTEFKAFQVDHGIECTYFHVATNDDHKYPVPSHSAVRESCILTPTPCSNKKQERLPPPGLLLIYFSYFPPHDYY